MAIPILNHLDLRNVSELQNATLHTTTRASASHKAGKIIYESSTPAVYVSDGSAWFDLSGDIKQVKVIGDSGNYDVISGNFVLTIAGDTGITTSVTGSTLKIDLDDTAVTPQEYGSATAIPVFTVDQQGRLTAASTASITTTLTIDDASTTQDVSLATDDLQFLSASANEITTAVTKDGTDVKVTIGLPNDVTIGNDLTVTNDLDVDGTTNLDTVDIDGNVQIDGTLSVGVDDTGYDVKFFGDTSAKYLLWDASADKLIATGEIEAGSLDISGNADIDGTLHADGIDVDGTLEVDGTNISLDSTSTLNIDNSNTSNGINIGLITSGVPINIGHGTSLVTIGDDLKVNGNLTVVGTQTTLNETVKVVENNTIEFEGVTANDFEIKLTGGDPTADRVVALPDKTGTIALTTDTTDRQFTTLIGNASAVAINLKKHGVTVSGADKNLSAAIGNDSTQFMVQLIEVSSGLTAMADVARGADGLVTITFASAPANNAIRVLITKIG